MKTKIRAMAEAKLFQFICYDSKGQKRAGVAYICGTDAFWGKDVFSLFNKDQAQVAPKWLREQLQNPSADTVVLDFTGRVLHGPEVPSTAPAAAALVSDSPMGESEDSIPQG